MLVELGHRKSGHVLGFFWLLEAGRRMNRLWMTSGDRDSSMVLGTPLARRFHPVIRRLYLG